MPAPKQSYFDTNECRRCGESVVCLPDNKSNAYRPALCATCEREEHRIYWKKSALRRGDRLPSHAPTMNAPYYM